MSSLKMIPCKWSMSVFRFTLIEVVKYFLGMKNFLQQVNHKISTEIVYSFRILFVVVSDSHRLAVHKTSTQRIGKRNQLLPLSADESEVLLGSTGHNFYMLKFHGIV